MSETYRVWTSRWPRSRVQALPHSTSPRGAHDVRAAARESALTAAAPALTPTSTAGLRRRRPDAGPGRRGSARGASRGVRSAVARAATGDVQRPTSARTSSSSHPTCRRPTSSRWSTRSPPSRSTTRWARGRYALLFAPGTYGIGRAPAGLPGRLLHRGRGPRREPGRRRHQRPRRRLQPLSRSRQLHRPQQLLAVAVEPHHQRGRRRRLPRVRRVLGRLAGRADAPRRHHRRQPHADGLLHRRPAVRQRRLHRRLPHRRSSSTARSSSSWCATAASAAGRTRVWNQVFSGVEGAPAQSFPDPPYTTLPTTSVSRERPFLYLDG